MLTRHEPGDVVDVYHDVFGLEEGAYEGSARLLRFVNKDEIERTETWDLVFIDTGDAVTRRIPAPYDPQA